jgi:hypothetical protein
MDSPEAILVQNLRRYGEYTETINCRILMKRAGHLEDSEVIGTR